MLLSVDKIHIGVIDTTVNQETCRQSMVGRLLQNSTMYICMQQSILIQLQHRIFSFNDNIDSTSTLDIFIQRLYSFNFNTGYSVCKKNIFSQQVNNVCKTLVKMLFLGRHAALNMLFPGFQRRGGRRVGTSRWSFVE